MESGVNYLVSHAFCPNCKYKWTAVIEAEYIKITDKREYKIPDFLVCAECGSEFSEFHEVGSYKDYIK